MATSALSRPHSALLQQCKSEDKPSASASASKNKSLWTIATESLKTVSGAKDFFKVFLAATRAMQLAGAELSKVVLGVRGVFTVAKGALEATALPKHVASIMAAVRRGQFGKTLSEVVESIHVIYELTELFVSQAVIAISKVAMRNFLFVSHWSLIYVQGKEAMKQVVSVISGKLNKDQVNLALLKLAKAASYVGLAVCGIVGYLFNLVYSGWVMFAWSTSALAFSIFSRFYEGVHEKSIAQPIG
jgi:hypothetical protein